MFTGWSKYYFSKLTDIEKAAYRNISEAMALFEPEAEIDSSLIDESKKLLQYVLFDNPGFFYFDQSDINLRQSPISTRLCLNYICTKAEAEKLTREIKGKITDFINKNINSDTNMLTRQILIYKYLRDNITYDEKGIQNINEENHNITGALIHGVCVCEGFAKAYKAICDHLEISSMVVSGEGTKHPFEGPHAWNITRIDGVTAHCDATYDMTIGGGSYCYFNLSDAEISIDHSFDISFYPKCEPNTINYFYANGLIARDKSGLKDIIAKNAGKKSFSVKLLFPVTEAELSSLGFRTGRLRYNDTQNVIIFTV